MRKISPAYLHVNARGKIAPGCPEAAAAIASGGMTSRWRAGVAVVLAWMTAAACGGGSETDRLGVVVLVAGAEGFMGDDMHEAVRGFLEGPHAIARGQRAGSEAVLIVYAEDPVVRYAGPLDLLRADALGPKDAQRGQVKHDLRAGLAAATAALRDMRAPRRLLVLVTDGGGITEREAAAARRQLDALGVVVLAYRVEAVQVDDWPVEEQRARLRQLGDAMIDVLDPRALPPLVSMGVAVALTH